MTVPGRDPLFKALQARLAGGLQRFAQADSPEAWQALHDSLVSDAQAAAEAQLPDLAFRSWTLAARCALALGHSRLPPDQKEAWLVQTFQHLLAASQLGVQLSSRDGLAEFAAPLGELYEASRTQFWMSVPEAQVGEWLHHLALASEAFIPADLEDARGAAQTSALARALAQLSQRYGTQKAAEARLDFALLSAQRAGEVQAWLDALYARYGWMKNRASLAGARLAQAASLEDLEAWLQSQAQPQADPRLQLTQLRAQLLGLAEDFRQRFHSRAGRLWAAQYVAPMLTDFLVDEFAGRMQAAVLFETMDSLKARLLLDTIHIPFREFSAPQDRAQAVELEKQVLRFAPEPPRDARDQILHEMRLTSQLPIGLFETEQQRDPRLDELEALYASRTTGFQGSAPAWPYSRVAQALQPGEALIEYFVTTDSALPQHTVYLLVLTRQGLKAHQFPVKGDPSEGWAVRRMSVDDRQPIEDSPLGRSAINLRLAIQGGDEANADRQLQSLYELLIEPVRALGVHPEEFQRWIVVPHAMLHAIPFAALRQPNGPHLIEQVALALAPSASVWYGLQERPAAPVTSLIGFANPLLLDARWPPLPQAEAELERICRSLATLKCVTYVAEEATEAAVRAAAGKSLLHFATHGNFPESDVIDLHQILLAPDGQSDGRLHAEELRQLDLRAARLVTLSICNGGLYRTGPGDEPYGLIPALLTAGAQNVLGTLWSIEDQAGRAFMVEFYQHLLSAGPAAAYRRACTRFLKEGRPLRDWAAWALTGPGRAW